MTMTTILVFGEYGNAGSFEPSDDDDYLDIRTLFDLDTSAINIYANIAGASLESIKVKMHHIQYQINLLEVHLTQQVYNLQVTMAIIVIKILQLQIWQMLSSTTEQQAQQVQLD